jgi:signal transduction histidine kinase
VIGRQLKQLTRLVDDLLDLSRITRGKIELKMETLDAADVVHAAVETCRPLVDAQRHALTMTLPHERIGIRGDFARMAQVLGNLINNAAKYTDPGGRLEVAILHEGSRRVFPRARLGDGHSRGPRSRPCSSRSRSSSARSTVRRAGSASG